MVSLLCDSFLSWVVVALILCLRRWDGEEQEETPTSLILTVPFHIGIELGQNLEDINWMKFGE